jgi:hypothetical protein
MRFLSEVIAVIREWIIRTICPAGEESHGRVQVTSMVPTDIQPPWLCAYELEQVDLIGQQLDQKLMELQAAVEALKACEDLTLPTPVVALSHSEIMDTIGFMRQGSKRIQRFAKRRTVEKKEKQ